MGYTAVGPASRRSAERYLAPEVLPSEHASARGAGRSGSAVDIYAAAIVLWEIVTQAAVYPAMSGRVLIDHVMRGGRPDQAEMQAASDDKAAGILLPLVEVMWSARPERRPSASDVLGQLAAIEST